MYTMEILNKIASNLSSLSGLNLKVIAGNGCYGLARQDDHGYEWMYNGMTKKELAEAMWGVIKF